MMNACKIEAAIAPDGSITLKDLPFAIGEVVEVIILDKSTLTGSIGNRSTNASDKTRIPDLGKGQILISDDFNAPLPDEFWLGEHQ
jgi:hypothetical protein